MAFLTKYGVARHIYVPVIKRAVVDFAVSADWTPAAGDVKISKDGGAAANVTNLPTAITMGNTAMWDFSLTATELQAAQVSVTVADSATKAVEDTMFDIETYGNASAEHPFDLATATQKVDLDTIKTQAVTCAGGVTVPAATLASTTNLTAGTVTTATNVTTVNGLAANVITAASINAAAMNGKGDWNIGKTGYALSAAGVQAIWDALTSALTTVGSIGKLLVDNVNATISSRLAAANISLSSGAVTVGTNNDKTGYSLASGGIGSGAHAAAELNAIADAILDRNMTTGTDSGTNSTAVRTVRQALRRLRNKEAISGGTGTVYKEDDSTTSWTYAATTAAGDPLTAVDPT